MDRYGVNYDPMVTRYTGPMVTRYIGWLSQLPGVKMSWGKKSKKKLSNLNNIHFLVPWLPGHQAHRWFVSGLSGKMSCRKKLETMSLVGKDWYFGLCKYYLVIWLKPGKNLRKPTW